LIISLVLVGLLLTTGAFAGSADQDQGWLIRKGATNVIDLSYPIAPEMTQAKFYPKYQADIWMGLSPEVDPDSGYPVKGWYARMITSMLEGHGTHVEASSHSYGERGLNIDEYPLRRFIGPAVVIDIRAKAKANPDYRVTVDDLLLWEKKYGRIPDGAFVIIYSGWGRYWGNDQAYFGLDKEGKQHYPSLSLAACRWLVENRYISAVGTECAALDGGVRETETKRPFANGPTRDILQAPPNDILYISYMANVDKLPERGVLIIAAPINFKGGYAGTVRALAVIP